MNRERPHDADRPYVDDDPEVQRAIDAVRESTPEAIITVLDDQGLFDAMLERMRARFRGRILGSIRTHELTQIARESVNSTLDISTPPQEVEEFPAPEVIPNPEDTQDEALIQTIEQVLRARARGEVSAHDALTEIREALHDESDQAPQLRTQIMLD